MFPKYLESSKDNTGTDNNELIEIACNTAVDLSGYRIALVNGRWGGIYKTLPISEMCFDFVVVSAVGMQNASPRGIVLYDANDGIVDSLSYEGDLTVLGWDLKDIGVSESSSTPIGFSLQKSGVGCVGSDFQWVEPSTATPGTLNNSQNIEC